MQGSRSAASSPVRTSPSPPRTAKRFGGRAGTSFDACYHKACDSVANVDFGILGQMADAGAVVAVRLAG